MNFHQSYERYSSSEILVSQTNYWICISVWPTDFYTHTFTYTPRCVSKKNIRGITDNNWAEYIIITKERISSGAYLEKAYALLIWLISGICPLCPMAGLASLNQHTDLQAHTQKYSQHRLVITTLKTYQISLSAKFSYTSLKNFRVIDLR